MSDSSATTRPFDSGTQYADWQQRNCRRCRKWDPDAADPDACQLDYAIGAAYLADGEVSIEIATRAGVPTGPLPHPYTWDCPERDTLPNPKETNDAHDSPNP